MFGCTLGGERRGCSRKCDADVKSARLSDRLLVLDRHRILIPSRDSVWSISGVEERGQKRPYRSSTSLNVFCSKQVDGQYRALKASLVLCLVVDAPRLENSSKRFVCHAGDG